MKTYHHKPLFLCALVIALSVSTGFAQKSKPAQKPRKSIIFAVLNDGHSIEPIAYVSDGKLEPAVNGSDDEAMITAFVKSYYKPGTSYPMLYGGAAAGTVSVTSANNKSECGKNTADVTTSSKTPLKGFVMSLATNGTIKNTTSYRRRPTAAERTEIERLVKAEYAKNKLTPTTLHSQNLTALDVNNDGRPEFVGSYWVDIDKLTRGLLFFIAEKGASGKTTMTYSDYRSVDQASTMSGNIKDVDDGIYHEVLLEAYDYDGDGNAEIFTYEPSFEGAGFTAYKRSGATWVKAIEVSNYHCGY
ncbi:MAG: hypothetical protein ABJA02_00955 [Acidobacteriota bacterium]